MRERCRFPSNILRQLRNLKFITTTGMNNRAIDLEVCKELGITVSGTTMERKNTSTVETETANGPASSSRGTVEQTWALLLNLARRIRIEDAGVRRDNEQWQIGVATGVYSKTLGLVGVGRLGKQVATVGKAFGMRVVGWSPNLTKERAEESGVEFISTLNELLEISDVVSLHLVLAESTRGILGEKELNLMKKDSILINTSRGALINEEALIKTLKEEKILGAGLDVYDIEPLPKGHPLRTLENVILSPHMGYVDELAYSAWFPQTKENIEAFLSSSPIRTLVIDPPSGTH